MEKTVKTIDQEIFEGLEFATPGETIRARITTDGYCKYQDKHYSELHDCRSCHMVNYKHDCHNNVIPDRDLTD